MSLYTESRKTCFTYSAGGHYTELMKALDGIHFTNAYHATFYSPRFENESDVRRIILIHPRKKILRTLANAFQSFWYLLKERPKYIISTGADVSVATIILGRVFFGCTVIFIESAGNITPTLTGRMVHRFCNLFIVQWEEHLAYYPNAILGKGLLL